MKIVITGGGGFLGSRLARQLYAKGELGGRKISQLVLFDTVFAAGGPMHPRIERVQGDIADPATIERVLSADTTAVFHLAGVVSGAAEADFDLGMRVNLDGTRRLLERMRQCAVPPRMVYTSSVAAFGGDLPEELDDAITPTPQTSYGAQKVMGEYLIADYTRKGYIDGRSLRLPTIVVRAGKPNAAASSFASGILREPLNGVVSECPVGPDTGVWLLSPRKVVEAFVLAHDLPSASWPAGRVVNLPGISASVAQMLEALKAIAGAKTAALARFKPDERIQKIVETWPVRFRTPRALEMGFRPDENIESVIRDYIADEKITLA